MYFSNSNKKQKRIWKFGQNKFLKNKIASFFKSGEVDTTWNELAVSS